MYGGIMGHDGEQRPDRTDTAAVSGDPSRYAYARAALHRDDDPAGPPAERRVELALRSLTGVTDGPVPQADLDAIDGLRLRTSGATAFNQLSTLRNLQWLSIETTVPFDLAPLVDAVAGADALGDLSLSGPVDDIAPLARLHGLRILRLENTGVTDVRPLAGLAYLHDVGITDGPLADLSPLAALPLTRLFVYDTRVTDIGPLTGHPSLQVLGLCGCRIDDLSPTATMPSLHYVNLSRSRFVGLDALRTRLPHVTFEARADDAGPTPPEPATAAPTTAGPDARDAATLLARYRETEDFEERCALELPLVASRDPEAVQEVVRDREITAYTVRGMLFRDGVGNLPFAANPWGVGSGDDWSAALDRVWAPVADHAPRFVAAVRARTVALVLLADPQGSTHLAYLSVLSDADEPGSGPGLDDPRPDLYLQIVLGRAPEPTDATAVVPVMAGPVPRPVRDFRAAHAGFGRLRAEVDRNVDDWFGRGTGFATGRLDGLPPDRFVVGAGMIDWQGYLFDLDVLDDDGAPTVVSWAFKESGRISDHTSFWDWVDSDGAEVAFHG
ncbi:hypothetical protein Voc01_054700 [Virgisporangium ochraceum]|uniref:Leucine-rich repeat domain-containing protein n=2 Tax=Virgisporangium ochraceum TaxID=65505 RepID=A0A8J3ZYG3_9ACTN|nr:hypothetical protein Voc01_054700 [Virgisporangium ochraceum]